MSDTELVVEHPEDGVATVRLNRPEVRNALNTALRRRLAEAFLDLSHDEAVRAILITGGPAAFAAGADLTEMEEAGAAEMARRGTQLYWRAIAQCPKPVVAAINGFALGGGFELAMHADIIVAGRSALLGQPEIRVGIMPGAGGTQRLTRAVGKFKAMRMLLTGRPVSGVEAEAMGLVSEVVADEAVQDRALEIAREIAGLPPLAAGAIKEVVLAGLDASLETGLMLERKAFQLLFDTEDKGEGIRAFREKRKPRFKGR